MNPFPPIPGGLVSAALAATACSAEPLRVDPRNPYLLEYRGETFVGRTFGEHYGSVIHPDFDFVRYLDGLRADEQNLTRVVLLGFRSHQRAGQDPLSPPAVRFFQPWQRSTGQGTALDGAGKWDFSKWNEAYFARLRDFARACSDRGIVVEVCLFNTLYDSAPEFWNNSPFHPSNNVQGYGPASPADALRATDANLTAVQEQAVRRIVRELNGFDNIYFEIQNEPFWNQPGTGDAAEAAFHNQFLGIIRSEESALPKRHLVAHNFPNQIAALSNDFDLINCHYPFTVPSAPWVIGGENLLAGEYPRGKPLSLDESSAYDALSCRLEAWMFVLGGGGIYNGLDSGVFDPNSALIYSMQDPAGNLQPGLSMRAALANLGAYAESLDLHGLRRDPTWITGGLPVGARFQGMAKSGQQYVAYLHHGAVPATPYATVYSPIDSSNHTLNLQVYLPPGTWRAVWTNPADLSTIATESFAHDGGNRTLQGIVYQADVALRIDRADGGDATPPPQVRRLSASPPENSSVTLSWRASPAVDLASYRIYHRLDGGTPELVAELPGSQTGFRHAGTAADQAHFYQVTAVDLRGNESAPGVEVVSKIPSGPFDGVARSVPGIIQCEDYDSGGEGIVYHDSAPGNTGGAYRPLDGVDLAASDDGGIHLTNIAAGEWLRYTIRIAKTGVYDLRVRCRTPEAGCTLRFLVDGASLGAAFPIPANAGWQTVIIPDILLEEGARNLQFLIETAGTSGLAGDFNWISFMPQARPGPIARAGADQLVSDVDWDLSETVGLDASSSTQGAQPIVSHVWLRNGLPLANGLNPSVSLPVGLHRIRLVTTDASGFTDEDETVVEIRQRGFLNGGFENGLSAWSASGNCAATSMAGANEGTRAVVFGDNNSTSNGAVTQRFLAVAGQAYRISFAMGTRAFNTQLQTLSLKVNGHSTLLSKTYTLAGAGGGNVVWSGKVESFVSDADALEVEFRDVSGTSDSIDLLLDNVKITRILGAAMPEKPVMEAAGAGWRLSLTSPDVGTYQLLRSSNLTDWSVISTYEAVTPGIIRLDDPSPPSGAAFYRIGWGHP